MAVGSTEAMRFPRAFSTPGGGHLLLLLLTVQLKKKVPLRFHIANNKLCVATGTENR